MENIYKQDLIERYLKGTLSESEQEAVSLRLTTDPDFKAEVELHQQLHTEFADPKKLQLRDMMADILLQEPAPPELESNKWLKIGGIALLVLLGAGLIYWISASAQKELPTLPTQPIQQTPNPPKDSNQLDLPKPPVQEPIAMANTAAFKPNPVFESRLGNGGIRSSESAEVAFQSPGSGADYTLVNGQVKIQFKGSIKADDDEAGFPLQLSLYNNRSTDTPVAQFNPAILNRNEQSEKWNFSSKQTLRLPEGLYYFTLERQANAELVFVGKFTVGKKVPQEK